MFTIDRSSLRNTTIRRDYQFSNYLHAKQPTNPLNADVNANPNATSNTNPDLDPSVDLDSDAIGDPGVNVNASELANTADFDFDDELYSMGSPDNNNATPQSQNTSLRSLGSTSHILSTPQTLSVSQSLLLLRPTP
jgi:hypothetical protein